MLRCWRVRVLVRHRFPGATALPRQLLTVATDPDGAVGSARELCAAAWPHVDLVSVDLVVAVERRQP